MSRLFVIYKVVFVGFFMFLCYANAHAQTLRINVSDADTEKPVEYANVMWKSVGAEVFRNGTVTDENGNATFAVENLRRIHLKISCMGYEAFSDTVSTRLGKISVKLRPLVLNINEVVVYGKSQEKIIRESPEAVSVISVKELQGRSVSLESVLNKTTGLIIGRSGGTGSSSRIIVHGLEGNRVQILWDGMPMNTNDGSFSLDEIPIDIIERIEVYKSIIPARFGCDGLGGAINIVSKEFSTDYLDASYEIGSFNTHKASVFSRKNLPQKGILLGFGGYYTYSDNDYEFNVPERENLRVKRDHDLFRSYMVKGKVAFTKLWFDEISSEFGFYRRFNEIQGVLKNIQHAENDAKTFMLESKIKKHGFFSEKLDFESHFSLQHVWNNLTDTASMNYDFEGNSYLSPNGKGETDDVPHDTDDRFFDLNERLNFDYNITPNHNLNLNTLIHYAKRQPKDDIASEHAGFVIGGYPSTMASVVTGLTWEADLLEDRLINMLSAKVLHLDSKIEDLTSYEMMEPPKQKHNVATEFGWIESVKYEAVSQVHLKASYQRAVRLPSPNELFGDGISIFPAAGLRPEKSHNFNGGILVDKNHFLGMRRVQFDINAYYMYVTDMIKLIRQYRSAGYVNADKVEIKGIEGELKIDVSPTIYVYGNVTFQDVKDVLRYVPGSITPNPTYGMKLPNIPYFFANFGAEYHSDKLLGKKWYVKIFWDSKFTEEYYYFWEMTNLEKRRIPRSWINDVGVLLTYKGKYSFAAECHNIDDIENWDQYRQPLPGRSFHIKIRYTFSRYI